MRKIALAFALLFGLANGAAAQVPPYVYAITIGTVSAQILAANTLRKRAIFVNPNATASVAVCPSGPTRNAGATVTAVINGPGCVTILPYGSLTIDGGSAAGPQLSMPSAWLGIASAGASSLTIIEFE